MTKPVEAALIAEYVRLRLEADGLDRRYEEIEARMVEVELLLPDNYTYPGDPPLV